MKKAIILFNLGGPDSIKNVKPFLFNLFYDPAILNLPTILRYPLAKIISSRRAPIAKKIYDNSNIFLITRTNDETYQEVLKYIPEAKFDSTAKMIWSSKKKIKLNFIGSTSVIDKHHATNEPAPDPLPGPTGISFSLA